MKTKSFFFTFIFLMAVLMAACSSSNNNTGKPNASFENTRWVLRSLNDAKVFTPESGKEAFISFNSQSKFTGSGGCNNIFGGYSKSGNTIKIGPVARTEMFCEGRMDVENNFVKALEAAEKFKIKGDKLFLYDSSNGVAVFEVVYMN